MTTTSAELAAAVVRHISDLLEGRCTITRDEIEQTDQDPGLRDVLSGLFALHEEMQRRSEERTRVEGELGEAVRRLEEQNADLENRLSGLATLAAELSTPVIKVAEDVLMLPLIGSVDSTRAADVMDRLLTAVVRERVSYVILDLTGVGAIDTATADHFMRIIGALRLLGTKGIVAGVPPLVALTLISLGVELGGITTARDVRQALLLCKPIAAPSAK